MKKYLLVSLTILFAAAFVWAQDATTVEPTVDIEAEAKISWGVDLGTGDNAKAKHGFENKASWTVKFPLINKGNLTSSKNDVPVYGEIILKDISLDVVSKKSNNDGNFGLNGKVDGISAKLWFYGAYMTVFDKPSFKANYAKLWDPIDTDDFDADIYAFAPKFDGAGFKVGYANKDLMDLDVGVKLGSNGNWKSKDGAKDKYYMKHYDGDTKVGDDVVVVGTNFKADDKPPAGDYLVKEAGNSNPANHSKYGFGLDFSMKPLDKMLGVAVTVNSTLTNAKTYDTIDNGKKVTHPGYNTGVAESASAKDVFFNFGVGLTSEPIDGLSLKLGFDGASKFNTGNKTDKGEDINAFAWDASFAAAYKWVSGGVYVSSPGTVMAGYNAKAKSLSEVRITDLAAYVKFETKADKADATNLVEGLDAGAFVGLYRLLTYANKGDVKMQLPMLVKVWGAYKVNLNDSMWVKPFADVWAETNNHADTSSGDPALGLAYDLGVTFGPVEKVEVTAKWQHGTINKDLYQAVERSDPSSLKLTPVVNRMNDKGHKGRFVLSHKVIY